jgi:hypothetical protein
MEAARERETPDKSVSLQGRGMDLSSESQIEGHEFDAEEHLRNLVEAIIERNLLKLQRTKPEQKMNRERILKNCESSLVISWLVTWVARVLRVNAFEPMVGWKDEHP